jgi:hypothetical protein
MKVAGSDGRISINRFDVGGARPNIRPGFRCLGGEIRCPFDQDRRKVRVAGCLGECQKSLGLTHEIRPADHDEIPHSKTMMETSRGSTRIVP